VHTFIGIDLAWSRKNCTALAAIRMDSGAELIDIAYLRRDSDILGWTLKKCGNGGCVAGVDAPLIVKNRTGARPADVSLSREFRRFEAGALPANLKNAYRGPELMEQFIAAGFSYDPHSVPEIHTRSLIEFFPHPAEVVLFGLEKTLKYKRGNVEDRKKELSRLQRLIFETFTRTEPRLLSNDLLEGICSEDLSSMKGQGRKRFEDLLDAIVCAYTAYYFWYWGEAKCMVFGDLSSGYIVTPYRL